MTRGARHRSVAGPPVWLAGSEEDRAARRARTKALKRRRVDATGGWVLSYVSTLAEDGIPPPRSSARGGARSSIIEPSFFSSETWNHHSFVGQIILSSVIFFSRYSRYVYLRYIIL